MKTKIVAAFCFFAFSGIGFCQDSITKKVSTYRTKLFDHVKDLNGFYQAFLKKGNSQTEYAHSFANVAVTERDRCTWVWRLLAIQDNFTKSINVAEKKALQEFIHDSITVEIESMDKQINFISEILPHSNDQNLNALAVKLKNDLRDLRAIYKEYPKATD